MNELEQLKREVEELKEWKRLLERSATIPLNIDQSFRERFFVQAQFEESAKDPDSEDVEINEGGVAVVRALKEPDDFLQTELNGVTYYIPVFL